MRSRPLLLAAILIVGSIAPLAAFAQTTPRVFRVGWLDHFDAAMEEHAPFIRELKTLGYDEGRHFTLVVRKADFDVSRLPALATELARLNLDVIVAFRDAAIRAAIRATTTTPIVMVGAVDPVETGLIAALGRPGGNVTGVSGSAGLLAAKQLELLKELLPRARRVLVLRATGSDPGQRLSARLQTAARQLGLERRIVDIGNRGDVERVFGTLAAQPADGVVAFTQGMTPVAVEIRIAQLGRERKVPVISDAPLVTWEGGLMSYGASFAEFSRRAAHYVDRILKGARPADLPVEEPATFDFVVNAATAKVLGLTIPPAILLRADRVIE